MGLSESDLFSVDNALEMILVFDRKGIISYANHVAKKKLGYDSDLHGVHIKEVFPNTFQMAEEGFATEYTFGNETQNLVAYRKNLTCFPGSQDYGQCVPSGNLYLYGKRYP
jgi:PAS domain S-box-containing protein